MPGTPRLWINLWIKWGRAGVSLWRRGAPLGDDLVDHRKMLV